MLFFFFFFCSESWELLQPTFCKNVVIGRPWWRSGWESACQCREHGFEPWSGKIPHAAEQLGPWATSAEPARLEPVLRNKRGRDSERPAHCSEEWPPLAATRESPRAETKTQHNQKKKKKKCGDSLLILSAQSMIGISSALQLLLSTTATVRSAMIDFPILQGLQ